MIKVGQYVHWAGASGGGGGAEDLVIDEVRYTDRQATEHVFFTEERAGYSVTLREIEALGVKVVRVAHETPAAFSEAYRSEGIDILNVKSCGDVQAGYQAALDLDLPIVDVAACVAFSRGWELKSSKVAPVYLCQKHWIHGSNGNVNFRVINAGVDIAALSAPRAARGYEGFKTYAKTKWGLDPNKPVVGWYGRFDQFKCPFTFVDIASAIKSRVPDCQFIMFGDGADRGRAIHLANLAKIDIKMPGFTREKADAFACMDVYCMPTWQESFGRVNAEAMAVGTPIVTSKYPVCEEVCGESALYSEFDRQDPMPYQRVAEFSDKCVELLSDPGARARMSEAGMARAAEHYNAEKMAISYLNLYKELLGR